MRAVMTAIAVIAISALTLLAVQGTGRLSGPVVLTFSSSHGVHAGDVLAGLLALIAVSTVLWLGRR